MFRYRIATIATRALPGHCRAGFGPVWPQPQGPGPMNVVEREAARPQAVADKSAEVSTVAAASAALARPLHRTLSLAGDCSVVCADGRRRRHAAGADRGAPHDRLRVLARQCQP